MVDNILFMQKNHLYKIILPLLGIFSVGIWIQSQILLSLDIGWLLTVGKRLLAGGKYYSDFFEVNPPMAAYIYMPAIWLSDWLHWNIIASAKFYIFTVITITIILCSILIQKIARLSKNTNELIAPFILTLAITLVLLPAHDFGQREQFSLMLGFPYLLTLAIRMKGGNIPISLAAYIGLIAGIGFAIKPYFLIPWLLVESYFIYKVKNYWAFFRTELLALIIINIIYLITLFVITPEYLYNVLPIIKNSYYFYFVYSWKAMLINPLVALWFITSLFYCKLKKYNGSQELINLIFLFNVGFLLVYVLQRTLWYYHFLPAMSLSFILLGLLLSSYIKTIRANNSPLIFFTTIYSILFLMLYPLAVAFGHIKFALYDLKDPAKKQLLNIIDNVDKNSSVYFLSSDMKLAYPLTNYSNTKSASRFPCLWLIHATLVKQHLNQDKASQVIAQQEKMFVIDSVIEDFLHNKPALVIVDKPKKVILENKPLEINFINFLSEDIRFHKLWQNYHYKETIGNHDVYIINTDYSDQPNLRRL